MEILKLREHSELAPEAASWFHSKWEIPVEEYAESIQECLSGGCVPQWYAAVENGQIIGGIGVIENDFHNRKDLRPNVCAVYVEENYRCRGIAGKLLGFVCEDMRSFGLKNLYLITDHTGFYERYRWKFLCMVQGDGESDMTRMYSYEL
ncbi:MAG: GNAT family N-acetyltransferase [Ruminococcus sp.]|jgi:GNAT superfamily N-acetyltransferase